MYFILDFRSLYRSFCRKKKKKKLFKIVSAEWLKIMCFYMISFIFNVVTLIFCVLAQ